ncbi:MAG: hypothetical protein ABSH14_17305, partial [Verrucomicrobiia bacterium]
MMTFMPAISFSVATNKVVFNGHAASAWERDEDGSDGSGKLSFELVGRHFADVFDGGRPKPLVNHVEVFRVLEIDLERMVTKTDDLRRGQVLRGQRKHIDRMLRITRPSLRQRPVFRQGHAVELRAGISHGTVEVCELSIEFHCHVERLLHRLLVVFGQTEDVIGNYVDIGGADVVDGLKYLLLPETLLDV